MASTEVVRLSEQTVHETGAVKVVLALAQDVPEKIAVASLVKPSEVKPLAINVILLLPADKEMGVLLMPPSVMVSV